MPMSIYSPDRWLRYSWQTNSRYYIAEVTQDLFGQWQLHRTWGAALQRVVTNSTSTLPATKKHC